MAVQIPFIKVSNGANHYCEDEDSNEPLPLGLEFQAQLYLFCKAVGVANMC